MSIPTLWRASCSCVANLKRSIIGLLVDGFRALLVVFIINASARKSPCCNPRPVPFPVYLGVAVSAAINCANKIEVGK